VLGGNISNAPAARAMGLAVIMLSNLFLVQVNSSDQDFVIRSIARLKKDRVMWAITLGTLLMLGIILYTPLSGFLKLAALSVGQLFSALGIAAAAVLWYELIKLLQRLRSRRALRTDPQAPLK
jgi:Ca2+-transporting ATPase